MLTVVSYLRGIPVKNSNPEKPKVLTYFINGVNASNDKGIVSNDTKLIAADVAVIQGYVHEDGKSAPHLTFRRQVLDFQKRHRKRTIIIDSNLFLYKDPGNTKGYLRYSFDGIFPKTGEYCNATPDPKRWEKLSKDLNITLKPWRRDGGHILLCLQRNGGWSMKGLDVVDFFKSSVNVIRQYTDRPIIVRTHPGDKKALDYRQQLYGKNVKLSENKTLAEDLRSAWASVVYNSSPSVASAIEGVPCFLIDPEYSQATEVSNLELANIENPIMVDRLPWLHKLAQCHWNDQDLLDGSAWRHMRQFL